jgi:putative pyruvate formate lyase activating enzyme
VRTDGRRGRCGADSTARVYRHRVEYGEELVLNPSHIFYLSGCNLQCAFCIAGQNAFDPQVGEPLSAELLSRTVRWGQSQGARNLQWAGGEPTIHLAAILEAMAGLGDRPPVVWKSNFYGSPESFRLLDGMVDVYVADFKFGNDACARRIAGVERYVATITRNLRIAAGQADLIVRHLLLPGHFECCYRPVVAWMREHLPTVKFSIRDGYLPCWKAQQYPDLAQPLARGVAQRAVELAVTGGLNVVC